MPHEGRTHPYRRTCHRCLGAENKPEGGIAINPNNASLVCSAGQTCGLENRTGPLRLPLHLPERIAMIDKSEARRTSRAYAAALFASLFGHKRTNCWSLLIPNNNSHAQTEKPTLDTNADRQTENIKRKYWPVSVAP